jgi:hypothetical protein
MLATFEVNKTLIRAFQEIRKACDEKKIKKNIFFEMNYVGRSRRLHHPTPPTGFPRGLDPPPFSAFE